ncbi:MAG: tRNA (N(6)-L-threonylcarbamoyladenosine(37)-C(2))-methylthiotransferase MtaB [Sphaerochaetaceae bacterium]|nr:tRNA (N(6)-L-threonylcarbamoyladenosine(37)-C(2))-methylthiotransferase MtaB [Sphaerochaetaceae bacterium]
MNVYVYTLGCRVNQCESEAVAQAFSEKGHNVVKDYIKADLILVNTCTVTAKAEQKARRMIRLFSSAAVTIVSGCYAIAGSSVLEKLGTRVVVLPLSRKAELLRLPDSLEGVPSEDLLYAVRDFCSEKKSFSTSVFDFKAADFAFHSRSFLKIQDGCDNNCGYCRVHVARGPSHSLDASEVVRRALEIEKHGYHEIVLTGVNLTMYDHEGKGLGGLLEKLLPQLSVDTRIRLSSMEPDHVDDRLLDQMGNFRMQSHFHIPVQSASDKVLKRVGRTYESSYLDYIVKRLREVKDDPFLGCDIITGLPAEGDEEFEETRAFLERNAFSAVHVFPFSPRPDTPLFNARDKAPESVRDARAAILRTLSENSKKAYAERQVGRSLEAIIEEKTRGKWYATTGNYLRVEVSGVDDSYRCGDLIKVKMTGADKAELEK